MPRDAMNLLACVARRLVTHEVAGRARWPARRTRSLRDDSASVPRSERETTSKEGEECPGKSDHCGKKTDGSCKDITPWIEGKCLLSFVSLW